MRIEELIRGVALPETEVESVFVYTYTAAMNGSKLYEIYLELSKNINDDDCELLGSIIVAYALAEKSLLEVDFTGIDDDDRH